MQTEQMSHSGDSQEAEWVAALKQAVSDANANSVAQDSCGSGVEEFLRSLPPGYIQETDLAEALDDLEVVTMLRGSRGDGDDTFVSDLHLTPEGGVGQLRLRLYSRQRLELSELFPRIESFGLSVSEAVPWRFAALSSGEGAEEASEPAIYMLDFGLRLASDAVGLLEAVAEGGMLSQALRRAMAGVTEVDGLNALILEAGLDWKEVELLRAYSHYRNQLGVVSASVSDDSLVRFPAVARQLVQLFRSRFDPAVADHEGAVQSSRAALGAALGEVPDLEHHQSLRSFADLVEATVRTSWFRAMGETTGRAIALKIDSSKVPDMPAPHPMFETFVYSPALEGIHLRFGRVARGGIRFSDRPDDLRTEILGLAKAQMKKNAIIVPTGAKGGFVLRGTSDGGSEGLRGDAAVRSGYSTFIESLLDVTDDVDGDDIIHPESVTCVDGDDPYLVVAADKGTGKFSDLANSISSRRGYWLDDAFASGGSQGYDHKGMAITARGAWEAVKRHLRQLGLDAQTAPIKVVGVGDMSGDVFGNGMLQSSSMRLVAAFDHRDIFIDPDPNPAVSYEERLRLSQLPTSSWADYRKELISTGGGIWSRHTIEIDLPPAAASILGLQPGPISPPEVVRAILAAPVDLIWFGGIGTYVKASGEADSEVGDHQNDAVRVTAEQLRARVVAEGANLAVTQRGRVHYSRHGGLINADFIDNAAGVATSDREVNLKILMAIAENDGQIDRAGRDEMLAAVTDDVAAAVLSQVNRSAAVLSRAVATSAVELPSYVTLIDELCRSGRLQREVEFLPDPEETDRRMAAGAGLVRPELAVLLAYTKSHIVSEVLKSGLLDDPTLMECAKRYFPERIVNALGDLLPRHRLYRELVATEVVGELVDNMGIIWAHETASQLGRSLSEVVAAFWAARTVTGAGVTWMALETLSSQLGPDAEQAVHGQLCASVSRLARYYLRRSASPVPVMIIGEDAEVAEHLALLARDEQSEEPAEVSALERIVGVEAAIPADMRSASTEAVLRADSGIVGDVLRSSSTSLDMAARVLEHLDAIIGADRLLERLAKLEAPGRWSHSEAACLCDDVQVARHELLAKVVALPGLDDASGDGASLLSVVDAWMNERKGSLERLRSAIEAPAQPALGEELSVLSQAVRRMAALSAVR